MSKGSNKSVQVQNVTNTHSDDAARLITMVQGVISNDPNKEGINMMSGIQVGKQCTEQLTLYRTVMEQRALNNMLVCSHSLIKQTTNNHHNQQHICKYYSKYNL